MIISPLNFKNKSGFCTYLTLHDLDEQFIPSENDFIKMFENLPVIDSLTILSFIEKKIFFTKNDHQIQKEINSIFFDEDISILLLSTLSTKNIDAIYHLQQIYYCMTNVLIYGNYKNNPITSDQKILLGKALVYTNDFCQQNEPPANSIVEDPYKNLIAQLWQIGEFYYAQSIDICTEIGRANLIFNNKNTFGLEFAKSFKKELGVELTLFWAIVETLIAKWHSDYLSLNTNSLLLDVRKWFGPIKKDELESVLKILKLLSTNIIESKKSIKNKINSFSNLNFNFIYFQENPLIEIEKDKFLCLSIYYLIENSFKNLIEIIKKSNRETKIINKLSDLQGQAYEAYLKERFEGVYNTSFNKRFYFGLKKKASQIADGIIDYSNQLVFLEFKSSKIQKKFKMTNNVSDINDALKDFLTKKGAAQLHKGIMNFKKGIYKIYDQKNHPIESNSIKQYFPIIISCIEKIPQTYLLSKHYQKLLEQNKLLIDSNISPLIILDLNETEFLLDLVNSGHSLTEIIINKNSDIMTKDLSYRNFLMSSGYHRSGNNRPDYINQSYDNFTNTILNELKSIGIFSQEE